GADEFSDPPTVDLDALQQKEQVLLGEVDLEEDPFADVDEEKEELILRRHRRNTEHLTNPGIHSSAPTAADNTMTTSTACAFDKMASAAKQAGVKITVTSGFRTVARQEYFWNCYQTKACNNGNLAARPGTSKHGRDVALDLNTDCGSQSGVHQWLKNNGHKYGFKHTVKSEPWYWEFGGVGVRRASFS
ncbi:unnamed protein product, partial [Rotaria magnacalcarata]